MISVEEALARLLERADPLPVEIAPLTEAAGRVLARPLAAARDQPPFDSSMMDGYAVRNAETVPGAVFQVVGEAAAGHALDREIGPHQAARIFTGAPMPKGADRVVIQEDTTREGDRIALRGTLDSSIHVRRTGSDFQTGSMMDAPRILRPSDLSLLASMGHARLPVARRPVVALLTTGDELVMPGARPGPDQIVASNAIGLAAMIQAHGGHPRLLPIARDNAASLNEAFQLCEEVDLIVTIGGASVGKHDLIGPATRRLGMTPSFHKVAMRPGKPLMAGRLRGIPLMGLPGNPVSALVCGEVFLVPVLRAMLGLAKGPRPTQKAILGCDLGPNGPRAHYMRAHRTETGVIAFDRQDSALLSVLAKADCLLIRPPGQDPLTEGATVDILPV
ncbi:MAG: gephyrin-like molybdotransferase Glp [Pseudomonadota bacterium]